VLGTLAAWVLAWLINLMLLLLRRLSSKTEHKIVYNICFPVLFYNRVGCLLLADSSFKFALSCSANIFYVDCFPFSGLLRVLFVPNFAQEEATAW
jgi:hypothetical protein